MFYLHFSNQGFDSLKSSCFARSAKHMRSAMFAPKAAKTESVQAHIEIFALFLNKNMYAVIATKLRHSLMQSASYYYLIIAFWVWKFLNYFSFKIFAKLLFGLAQLGLKTEIFFLKAFIVSIVTVWLHSVFFSLQCLEKSIWRLHFLVPNIFVKAFRTKFSQSRNGYTFKNLFALLIY